MIVRLYKGTYDEYGSKLDDCLWFQLDNFQFKLNDISELTTIINDLTKIRERLIDDSFSCHTK